MPYPQTVLGVPNSYSFDLFMRRLINAILDSRIVRVIERRFLLLELLLVILVTVGLALWGYKWDGNAAVEKLLGGDRSTIYSTLASMSGSLFGFTFAAISFVVGLSNRDRLHHLRTSAHFSTLRRAFMSAICWSGFAAIVAVYALIVDRGNAPTFYLVYTVFFATVLLTIRVANCVLLLALLIEVIMQPSRASVAGRENRSSQQTTSDD